jgi:hypothetical protein
VKKAAFRGVVVRSPHPFCIWMAWLVEKETDGDIYYVAIDT